MKKSYRLEDLDCAHCAAKIENEVGKLPGVACAAVNLLAQKMTVECDEAAASTLLASVVKIVKKFEPDVEVEEIQ